MRGSKQKAERRSKAQKQFTEITTSAEAAAAAVATTAPSATLQHTLIHTQRGRERERDTQTAANCETHSKSYALTQFGADETEENVQRFGARIA